MADILNLPRGPSKRRGRMSTRMDFTPMVDLGFLLITFFMLTTALARPNMMALAMPDDKGEPEPVKRSKVLTLMLGHRNQVLWYEGQDLVQSDSTGYDAAGLRKVILAKKEKVDRQWGQQTYMDGKTGALTKGSYLNVILKPGPQSSYKNLVDALDEMAICGVRYYCIVDLTPPEQAYMASLGL
ncbi:MAG TPA: biopolymer transporter ExbD [Saprospiraceae bacterium]|nr:biopolymer transporter ExbD [Saprospiraceae bacterium]